MTKSRPWSAIFCVLLTGWVLIPRGRAQANPPAVGLTDNERIEMCVRVAEGKMRANESFLKERVGPNKWQPLVVTHETKTSLKDLILNKDTMILTYRDFGT